MLVWRISDLIADDEIYRVWVDESHLLDTLTEISDDALNIVAWTLRIARLVILIWIPMALLFLVEIVFLGWTGSIFALILGTACVCSSVPRHIKLERELLEIRNVE